MSTPSTSNTNANIPGGAPLVDQSGQITQVWYQFLLALFNRSGGSGTPTDITGLQKQVTAQNVAINTAVPVQPRPVLIGEGMVPVQRPAAPDFSQGMVYQPPGAYLTQVSLAGYDTIAAAIARYASPPALGNTTPAAVAATTLSANANAKVHASNTSAQSIPNNTATVVTGWTLDFDDTGEWNSATGTFTAAQAKRIAVETQIVYNGVAPTGSGFQTQIFMNGVLKGCGFNISPNATNAAIATRADAIGILAAGQTMQIKALQQSGGALPLNTAPMFCTVSIKQIP